jgi:hypothetical protein
MLIELAGIELESGLHTNLVVMLSAPIELVLKLKEMELNPMGTCMTYTWPLFTKVDRTVGGNN